MYDMRKSVPNVRLFISLAAVLVLAACGQKKAVEDKAFYDVSIAVDETFRPIMEEEMKVFNAKHPEAIMKPVYAPETDALNMLLTDSIRMVLATRPLSQKEKDAIRATYQLQVRQQPVAYDAVALIINRANRDSLISIMDLERIVTGQITRWEQLQNATSRGEIEVVFDNSNSSCVRYVRDSVCGGAELRGNIKEAVTNQKVIEYVAQTPGALGIIGVDWLRNADDSTNLTFNKNIRVMSVGYSSVTTEDNCFQPVQYYIATGQYPFTRCLYLITTDPRPKAFGVYFYFFMRDQDAQLVITKSSQLLPYMPVQVKTVEMTE
jgi:phosphate transport system substrate-binding protein